MHPSDFDSYALSFYNMGVFVGLFCPYGLTICIPLALIHMPYYLTIWVFLLAVLSLWPYDMYPSDFDSYALLPYNMGVFVGLFCRYCLTICIPLTLIHMPCYLTIWVFLLAVLSLWPYDMHPSDFDL